MTRVASLRGLRHAVTNSHRAPEATLEYRAVYGLPSMASRDRPASKAREIVIGGEPMTGSDTALPRVTFSPDVQYVEPPQELQGTAGSSSLCTII